MSEIQIRPIEKADNLHIESVIRSVFMELELPLIGTAYADPETAQMYESYSKDRAIYFVVEQSGKIIGGAGISPLKNYNSEVCELQKMYSLPIMRGRGLGQKLLDTCLNAAKSRGFRSCYLETIPSLEAAVNLYVRNGFYAVDAQLGATGHHSCGLWMIKQLQ